MNTNELFKETEKYLATSNKKFINGNDVKTQKWIHEGYTKLDIDNTNDIVYNFIKDRKEKDPSFWIVDILVNRSHNKYEIVVRYIENDNNLNNLKAAVSLENLMKNVEKKEFENLIV